MNLNNYGEFVNDGVDEKIADDERECIHLAMYGIGGESGEVQDEIKKFMFHGKPFDREKLVKEMGDLFWYYQLVMNLFGLTLDEIVQANVAKLIERYPDRYSAWPGFK